MDYNTRIIQFKYNSYYCFNTLLFFFNFKYIGKPEKPGNGTLILLYKGKQDNSIIELYFREKPSHAGKFYPWQALTGMLPEQDDQVVPDNRDSVVPEDIQVGDEEYMQVDDVIEKPIEVGDQVVPGNYINDR
ncbi:unnamed protein product [Gordionus sp. m RMFG-2023]